MMILFDTNILIDHLKGKAEATHSLQECLAEQNIMSCSVITTIELMSGMRPHEERQLKDFLSAFEKIGVTDTIATIAGTYMNLYRKSHGINIADAIIAATAKYTGAHLYTLNTRHYPMQDIVIVKPY